LKRWELNTASASSTLINGEAYLLARIARSMLLVNFGAGGAGLRAAVQAAHKRAFAPHL